MKYVIEFASVLSTTIVAEKHRVQFMKFMVTFISMKHSHKKNKQDIAPLCVSDPHSFM
jgi:hypothetical protein